MLFVPSINGISHDFTEDTNEEDIVAGAQVWLLLFYFLFFIFHFFNIKNRQRWPVFVISRRTFAHVA